MQNTGTNKAPFADELFSVDPWTCMVEEVGTKEKPKRIFYAVHQEREEMHELDLNTYRDPSPETFRQLIALGFPKRVTGSPLTADQIELMWWRRFGIKPEEKAA
ncbi:hypothetical protein [Oceanicola sp. S124]|uniref:hypothetical protein n=1 Tax=Oceanicola sp. S124 TaxID=1042378 RepID=UPI000255A6AC|nr:hypothetical protein [Oceanicola sp. S124]